MPLEYKSGTRIYVLAKPYISEPDYRLTIGLYSQSLEQGILRETSEPVGEIGGIGEVLGSDWVGMRQREVGQAQAWLYRQDRTLILWEALLEHWYRKEDPRTDENLKTIWLGFEGFLLRTLPQQVDRIATPSWEPLYDQDKEAWPQFLKGLGYSRINERAFGKETGLDGRQVGR